MLFTTAFKFLYQTYFKHNHHISTFCYVLYDA